MKNFDKSARIPVLFSLQRLMLLAIFGLERPVGSMELRELPRKLWRDAFKLQCAVVDREELLKLGAMLM